MKIVLLFVFLSALFDGSSSQSYEFFYVPLYKTWSDAQMYCRQHYTDLATIKDKTDHDYVASFGGTQFIWIGLYRMTTDNPWIWSDQSQLAFSLWTSREPDILTSTVPVCVRANIEGWYDTPCTYSFPFVCYMEKKRQILRLEVKSDQNVNDPEVMTEVLQKMEQILKMKGLDENATMSWKIQSDGNVFQKYQKRNVTKQFCH